MESGQEINNPRTEKVIEQIKKVKVVDISLTDSFFNGFFFTLGSLTAIIIVGIILFILSITVFSSLINLYKPPSNVIQRNY